MEDATKSSPATSKHEESPLPTTTVPPTQTQQNQLTSSAKKQKIDLTCTKNISTLSQAKVLFSKAWTDTKSGKCGLTVQAVLFVFLFFVSTKNVLAAYFTLYLCGTLPAGFFLEGVMNDRVKKFRSTFKLMGVTDTAYLLGNSTFYIIYGFVVGMLFMIYLAIGQSLEILDRVYFNEFYTAFYLIVSFLLYLASLMIMNYFVSLCLKGSQDSLKVSEMLTGIINLLTLLPVLKANYSPTKSVGDYTVLDYINLAFPQGLFRLIFFNNFYLIDEMYTDLKLINLGAQALQLLVYLGIVYAMMLFVSSDSGVTYKFFGKKEKNKEASDHLKEALNDEDEGAEAAETGGGGEQNLLTNNGGIATKKAILKIRNVEKAYGPFKAVDGVNFDIYTNTITCILGHNGAGKTTLINCVCGMSPPTKGAIYLSGRDVWSSPDVLAGNVGYCTSTDVLYEDMTVKEFLIFIARLKGIVEPASHIQKILEKCNLAPHTLTLCKNLSGGTKRRTSIASALIGNPRILVLDEPSSGIDPSNRREIWELVENLKSHDTVIILTTHHLEEAEYLSQDVIIMDRGKIDIRGTPSDIMKKYGIGYRVTIEGIQTKHELGQLMIQVIDSCRERFTEQTDLSLDSSGRNTFKADLQVDSSALETHGRVKFTIPVDAKHQTGQILSLLESLELTYQIESNTLEEAFVNLGEVKSDSQSKRKGKDIRSEIYKTLFNKKYSSSTGRKLSALVYRRFTLFFKSEVDTISYVFMIVLPGLISWMVQTEPQDNPGGDNKVFELTKLVSSCVFIIYIFCTGCSLYADLPYKERKVRMRYYLKMLGVDSWIYYGHLYLTDLLFMTFMVVLAQGFSFLLIGNDLNSADFSIVDLFDLTAFVVLWGFSFVSQSNSPSNSNFRDFHKKST